MYLLVEKLKKFLFLYSEVGCAKVRKICVNYMVVFVYFLNLHFSVMAVV